MAKIPEEYGDVVQKQVLDIEWIRDELLDMDSLADPLLGIGSWDDAVVIDLPEKCRLVASVDGPYAKRLVNKSALIHAATDVVVKGGKPIFALDTLIGPLPEIREMLSSLKKQSLSMGIPLLGGNTMIEDAVPRCNLTVIGTLLTPEPIRDSGARPGDLLVLLGEPVWGSMEERIPKAERMFEAWYNLILDGSQVNAAKDVTKGGLVSCAYEMAQKAGLEYSLEKDLPYSLTRSLDNFLVSVPESVVDQVEMACAKAGCDWRVVGRML